MDVVVKGRHFHVSDRIRDYATEKIGKAGKIIDGIVMGAAEVELYTEKNPSIPNNHIAEVTVYTKGPVIRAKEAAVDMFAAIDLLADKFEQRSRKMKGKIQDRHAGRQADVAMFAASGRGLPAEDFEEEMGEERQIVKTKALALKPMTAEEAILQLELLGHDFFVFTSAETEEINVLYRRADGDYGLIQPRTS